MENNNPQKKQFGLILACKLADFDIEKQQVVDAFESAGFDKKFFPSDRMPRRAFAKALKSSVEGENFLVRPVINEKGIMTCGLVQEDRDKTVKDLKYQVPNVLTLDSRLETITSKTNFRTQPIIDEYKASRQKLGTPEVALVIKLILYDAMGISVLCNKAVFIPYKFKESIERLKVLFEKLLSHDVECEIEALFVDDDSQTRNTIIRQFMKQTLATLGKELTFTIDQRKKYEEGRVKFLKPSAFRKQLARVQQIEERIKLYIPLLELSTEDAETLIQKMTQLDNEINKNIEFAAKNAEKIKKPTIQEAFGN